MLEVPSKEIINSLRSRDRNVQRISDTVIKNVGFKTPPFQGGFILGIGIFTK